MRPFHLVIIGDVGGPTTYHVGDEAMLQANVAAIRQLIPHATITVVSRDPVWTSRAYQVEAVLPIGFPPAAAAEDAQRLRLLADIQDRVSRWGTEATDLMLPGSAVIQALAHAHGLLISGGGNLSSTWPEHVMERVALMQICQRLDKPVVVVGQTIGPDLGSVERQVLGSTLPHAHFVGVRELPSAAQALALGVPISRLRYQMDDAAFLAEQPPVDMRLRALIDQSSLPWIAVTVDPLVIECSDDALVSLARQLDQIRANCGGRLLFVPHVAGSAEQHILPDAMACQRLIDRLHEPDRAVLVDVLLAPEVRWLTARAALVISTRYHPLIFALTSGVPSIGIYADEYRRVKLQGALAHGDLDHWCLDVETAVSGGLLSLADRLWAERSTVRDHLQQRQAAWLAAERQRWHEVCHALGVLISAHQPDGRSAGSLLGQEPMMLAHRLLRAVQQRDEHRQVDVQRLVRARVEAERYARTLEEELERQRMAQAEAERYARALEEELERQRMAQAEAERYARALEEERHAPSGTAEPSAPD